jgi:hypothetical protein
LEIEKTSCNRGEVSYERPGVLHGYLARGGRVLVDDLASRVLASAAAARDGQIRLNFAKRFGALVDNFANLTIADGSADTNVHDADPVGRCGHFKG